MGIVLYIGITFTVCAGVWMLFELSLFSKHRAIVFEENRPVKIYKASKVGSNKDLFKFPDAKKGIAPKDNVLCFKSKYEISFWVKKNGVCAPVNIDLDHKKINFIAVQEQVILMESLKKIQEKVKVGWWEKNKEIVMSFTILIIAFMIYIYTIKKAGEIDQESVRILASGIKDITNSTQTTESNINKIVHYINRE